MLPVLIRIGNFQLYSYGVMLFISFVLGIMIVERRAQRFGVEPKKITDLALWVLLAVVLGSRLFYVAFHWDEFRNDLVGIIRFWGNPPGLSGLMFYGGFLGAFIAGLVFVGLNRLPLLKMLDAVAPALVLGEGFTRIGCFLNGCCFGKPTACPLGMVFPAGSAAGAQFPNQTIHPTQLYSSLAGFVLFGVALLLERRKLKPGVLFGIILLLYSLFRFGIDFVRYYEDAANFWGNQAVALGLSLLGLGLIVVLSRRR
ncbi:MAG: prolipoprotein diacylglyceryl transferase [candidate division WOR-3 bacterium]|uniref:Phosphatidylglycerol--prolipoprotein diacylglyceryl transferase n=1 Tax=candidate division WOR-3 bacterium TaxID=2052148 RepID=A0A7C3ERD0_UNCW3|nr:prolipoprotein diacylglyceryl transferase [candidate division WOR-3 bacterium]